MAMAVRRSRQVPDLKNHSSVVTFKLAMLLAVAFSILVDLRRVDLRPWSRSLIIFDSRVFSLVQRRNFLSHLHALLLLSPHFEVGARS